MEHGEWRGQPTSGNVTELGQAMAALRVAEERFRLLMENVQDFAIFLMDLQGRVIDWNEGTERLLGYFANEILGQPFARFFTGDDVRTGKPEQELQTAAAAGRKAEERWLMRKDRSRFWASGVTTALKDDKGQLRGFVTILRDLTGRKKLEEALQQRAEALAEANRLKDDFLAMLGHELRNPLAPILNAVQILRQAGTKGPLADQTLDMVERQLKNVTRLVDDLLDVSRIARGKFTLEKELVDVAMVVNQAVESCRSFIDGRNHELSVSQPGETVRVEADPARLQQVICNLLINAARYTEPGGHIWLMTAREGDEVVVRVKDTGIGVRAEVLSKIFELFTQGDRAPDRPQEGLGIGLTLVRRLVEMHGGSVAASSPGPGQGSEFVVRLPLISSAALEKFRRDPKGHVPPGRLYRVLVVEDNRDCARSLASILRLWGHEVRVAYDGPSALEVARSQQPQVVFLDIGLPKGMNGFEVALALREQPDLKNALVVALTGFGQDEDRRRAKEAGCDHHLTKPVDPKDLQRLLASHEPAMTC